MGFTRFFRKIFCLSKSSKAYENDYNDSNLWYQDTVSISESTCEPRPTTPLGWVSTEKDYNSAVTMHETICAIYQLDGPSVDVLFFTPDLEDVVFTVSGVWYTTHCIDGWPYTVLSPMHNDDIMFTIKNSKKWHKSLKLQEVKPFIKDIQ
ncbi:hypothetical protein BDQ12DRAFT_664173 [Crucibulum laeve]|uniref:Uncharacterized protein n=1 Tax=Crucibulum laeve TaxID=68775 RepID=A0A5C3MJJ9_9AGAR|nr:hypothetical protein BDQ12DRAFT_664173 [Crucibulum laeve]